MARALGRVTLTIHRPLDSVPSMTRPNLTTALQLALRAAVAAGLSVTIGHLLRIQNPLYAMVAAVIVMDLSPADTRRLALSRLAGTVLGAAMGALLSQVMPSSPWSIGLGIFFSMFLSHLLRLQDTARLAGFVCGIVLLSHSDDPWTYASHRLLESTLGIALAVLVSYVPKLIPARPATG